MGYSQADWAYFSIRELRHFPRSVVFTGAKVRPSRQLATELTASDPNRIIMAGAFELSENYL
jgi:hypothetical protein